METKKFFTIEPKPVELIPGKTLKEKVKEIVKMAPVTLPEKPGLELGIEETKDVLVFGIDLANAAIEALSDGKLSITDFPLFIKPIIGLPKALSGIDKVPAELGDLTVIEKDEIIAIVQEKLVVNNEDAAVIAQKSIEVVYRIYDLIKTITKK